MKKDRPPKRDEGRKIRAAMRRALEEAPEREDGFEPDMGCGSVMDTFDPRNAARSDRERKPKKNA